MSWRINLTNNQIRQGIKEGNWEWLYEHDQYSQLLRDVDKEPLLAGFAEARIDFAPTYKFDKNSDSYDSGLIKQSPAYADRILLKGGTAGSLREMTYYDSRDIRLSDHRPVLAFFSF
jgi:hypothetical protein